MLMNFKYYTSTKILFGKDTENQAPELIKANGGHRVLIHYGGHSAEKSGLLDRICRLLKEAGLEYELLGGVVPNPRLSKVEEGIKICRDRNIDFILAVGGGSVIDSAKGIGAGAAGTCPVWDYYDRRLTPTACLPIGVVLTIAAAGSEMSPVSVVTKEEGELKRSFSADCARPKFALLNPTLTYGLPTYQIASGCTDIMVHTMERYFAQGETLELIDSVAEALLRNVIKYSQIALRRPEDYKARAEIMWAGTMSHNDMTGDRTIGDWASHQLEHELGGVYDIAHGAGLAAVWGSWARYVMPTNPSRFAQFAVNVFDIAPDKDATTTALEGIAAMESVFKALGMPTCLRDMDIHLSPEEIKTLAYKCSFMGKRTIGGFRVLEIPDIEKIYEMANK